MMLRWLALLLLALPLRADTIPLAPSFDSRLIHVADAGNDAGDGTASDPVRSLAVAYAMLRDGEPDWLLLRRGDTWLTPLPTWRKSGRSATERMVLTAYGPGPRPTINPGLQSAFVKSGPAVHDLAVDGLAFTSAYSGAPSEGRVEAFVFTGPGSNIVIQGCHLHNWTNGIIVAHEASDCITGLQIRECVVTDCYSWDSYGGGAVYLQACAGYVIDGCTIDRVGYRTGPDPSVFRGHALYLHESNLPGSVTDNRISRVGSIAILCRAGGTITGNVIDRAGIGIYIANHPSLVARNIITHGVDASSTQPLGIGIQVFQCHDARVEDNTIVNCIASATNQAAITVELYTGPGATYVEHYRASIRRNVVRGWAPALRVTAPVVDLTVEGNAFHDLCLADVDGNGLLNVNDFVYFQKVFIDCTE